MKISGEQKFKLDAVTLDWGDQIPASKNVNCNGPNKVFIYSMAYRDNIKAKFIDAGF
jgi:hypothetical protein